MKFSKGDTVKIKSLLNNKSNNNVMGFICDYDSSALNAKVLRAENILAHVSSKEFYVREWSKRAKSIFKMGTSKDIYKVTIVDKLKSCRILLTERT